MRLTPPDHRRARLGIYEPSVGKSGPSRYVESLLASIDPDEFDVTLYCHSSGPYAQYTTIQHIPINPISPLAASPRPARKKRLLIPTSFKLWSGFARESRRLAAIFRAHPVDLLHTNNTGCEESPLAARLAKIPRVIGTFHTDPTYDLTGHRSHLPHRALEHLSNRCLHSAIAVSHTTRQNWLDRTGLPANRVTTIHNGITPFASRDRAAARQRLGLPADRLIVGGVGRLDHAKGFHDLLTAVALLARDHPTLCLALAGQGPLRDSLETYAGHLGIRDRVHFLGFQADVADVYAALDVFALSSLCEALPYALLDAMAARLPIVATAVGGVPEVVVPGTTGFLAPARNPEAFAAFLHPLLGNARLRRDMGGAGLHRAVQDFGEQTMVTRTLGLYRKLLGISPPHHEALRLAA